jgi:carbon storage regulator
MLVLSRKCEQSLLLGDDIVVTVLSIEGDRVKLGIDAPRSVSVLRQEVYQQVRSSNTTAAAPIARPQIRTIAAALRNRDASQPIQEEGTVPL